MKSNRKVSRFPVGFFGKLPAHGDFVDRQLDRAFIDVWDAWLQSGMAASQEQLENRWLQFFLVGPVWRFALNSGVINESAWVGVFIPSVDSVGRYYPLTVVRSVPASQTLIDLALGPQNWFDAAERCALSALNDGLTADRFLHQLNVITDSKRFEACAKSTWQSEEDNAPTPVRGKVGKVGEIGQVDKGAQAHAGLTITSDGGQVPYGAIHPLLDALLESRYQQYSLFWSSGSEYVMPSLSACSGLPDALGFCALLDGQWQQWGWESKPFAVERRGIKTVRQQSVSGRLQSPRVVLKDSAV